MWDGVGDSDAWGRMFTCINLNLCRLVKSKSSSHKMQNNSQSSLAVNDKLSEAKFYIWNDLCYISKKKIELENNGGVLHGKVILTIELTVCIKNGMYFNLCL